MCAYDDHVWEAQWSGRTRAGGQAGRVWGGSMTSKQAPSAIESEPLSSKRVETKRTLIPRPATPPKTALIALRRPVIGICKRVDRHRPKPTPWLQLSLTTLQARWL